MCGLAFQKQTSVLLSLYPPTVSLLSGSGRLSTSGTSLKVLEGSKVLISFRIGDWDHRNGSCAAVMWYDHLYGRTRVCRCFADCHTIRLMRQAARSVITIHNIVGIRWAPLRSFKFAIICSSHFSTFLVPSMANLSFRISWLIVRW